MTQEKLETVHIINEIKDLQLDLGMWFRGEIDDYKIITKRQATDMTIINSSGKYETRKDFNNRYRKNHNKHPNMKLSSEIIRIRRLTKSLMMVTYDQKTVINNTETHRITSAIFKYNPKLKNYAEWVHVHVTKLEN